MGKLKVIKTGPLATIQDKGRFGFRQYGIPQSGAMDIDSMKMVNSLVGNREDDPVIEFALAGMKLEAMEDTTAGLFGCGAKVNGQIISDLIVHLNRGDVLELLPPKAVYAYLSIGGLLKAKKDFGSYSTYVLGGFGGMDGRALKAGDILETNGKTSGSSIDQAQKEVSNVLKPIRIMKGPEWGWLKESVENKTFSIDASSNRMGIRLAGSTLQCDGSEIASSAVIPGTIQLPAGGHPIVLMNDCQTTGGYPRIGKVLDEDLGRLAQIPHKMSIEFVVV